jgi:hypothetical protein
MKQFKEIEFHVQRIAPNPSGIAIVSYKEVRHLFPSPGQSFILFIDDKKYTTSIRNLRRSGWTSFAKTFENNIRVTRAELCYRHRLKEGDLVFVTVENPFEKYRLYKPDF